MSKTAKDEILDRLKAAPQVDIPPRPTVPPLSELAWNQEERIEKFVETLTILGCTVHRAQDTEEVVSKLSDIARTEGLTKIVASEDDVVASLNLAEWGRSNNIEVFTPREGQDREAFKRIVFEEVQAGVTGVDLAVAESGTLCLIHDERQPRLVSVAPIHHIAVVPVGRIRPVYESVTDKLFEDRERVPSHVTFISGPSMTADIQASLFKGMHGPKTVTVILLEQAPT
jgi:L-lactate dehydrogenase complex protein LldG